MLLGRCSQTLLPPPPPPLLLLRQQQVLLLLLLLIGSWPPEKVLVLKKSEVSVTIWFKKSEHKLKGPIPVVEQV